MFTNDNVNIRCEFNHTPSTGSTTPIVDVYVTGDLAFQAMAVGKESMAGHWCVGMFDCCLQGIQPCEWKGNGHQ
jgi:hypothetical protein